MLMFKAPWVQIQQTASGEKNNFPAKVKSILNKGDNREVLLALNSEIEFCASLQNSDQLHIDQQVWLKIDPEQIILATLY